MKSQKVSKMKKLLISISIVALIFSLVSCTKAETPQNGDETTGASQENATSSASVIFEEDTTVGEGKNAVSVSVKTPDKTVKITIMTDKTVLGDALTESGLCEGEEGPYGLYIKKVNGISAVYETDGAYWSLTVNGEAASTGADGVEITDGAEYELVYTEA
ncbi:MAG: DUF4430 domain-containing protein [Ruminococcaceae bacterium]|nr:DUF4430 domain-containing protein [Oscillospiraceae bacterium]